MNIYNKNARSFFVVIIVLTLFIMCISRLVNLQIVNGQDFRKISEQKLFMSMSVKAPRGNILDRYGKVLASNRKGFSVQIQQTDLSKREFADMLKELIIVLEKENTIVNDQLPITFEEPFEFTLATPEDQIKWKKSLKLNDDLTAQQVIKKLVDIYDVNPENDDTTQRRLVGIIYDMKIRGFSVTTPYIIASDVSANVVATVKEKNSEFKGVEIIETPIRVYPNGSLAAHILGNVGVIYKEEYEKLKGKNYSMDAVIGKQGVELSFEEYLKGEDGIQGFEQTVSGLSDVVTSIPAKQGENVILTLDGDMQKVMENKLEETIRNISANGGIETGGDCKAGSAVAIDVRNGEILAMASYPTYIPSEYNKKYNELIKDPANPIWNRAIGGAYEPGSTFKMLTAITALEEGVIKPNDTILDEGVYKFYSDYQPECMEWKYGKTHGYVNTAKALEVSCNYYFYEVGRRVGINKINEYGKRFGFGQLTGIEIAGESKGAMASPENKKKRGETWYPGDTLQASIGQSDNLITPLQLVNYVATIANGGTRYKPHLLKAVKSHSDGSVIKEGTPEIVDKVEIQKENWNAVMEGMKRVTQEGTASSVFKNFFVEIGGKTGTAEVKGSNNGVFVAFAPFDNPEIAIAIVIEGGTAGYKAAPVAKAVFEEYFTNNEINDKYTINNLNQ